MDKMPGYIIVSKETVYDHHPDLSSKLAAHIKEWVNSVPSGTCVTLAEMMNFKGYPSGMPVETWTDPFEETGSFAGVSLLVKQGPLMEMSFGMPKMVMKH
jgi:hypothetical protein